jgi:hypothetical protein
MDKNLKNVEIGKFIITTLDHNSIKEHPQIGKKPNFSEYASKCEYTSTTL